MRKYGKERIEGKEENMGKKKEGTCGCWNNKGAMEGGKRMCIVKRNN